ncbi:MAG: hypothetical protein ACPLSO_01205 [Fervidicoccaceae archaeon]
MKPKIAPGLERAIPERNTLIGLYLQMEGSSPAPKFFEDLVNYSVLADRV